MNRNYGVSRRDLPRARLISNYGWGWIKDLVTIIALVAFMAAIATLTIEFPNGFTDLRDFQIDIVASGGHQ